MNNLSRQEQKELVGKTAIDRLIQEQVIIPGMKIGLGTGSTAMPAVLRLAQRIEDGTLHDIRAVSTSFQTTIACEELGIPVFSLNSREIGGELDFAIDGADEISPENHLIKGGGAALLLEKIVASCARRYVIIADESKETAVLGIHFPVPVEIISEARIPVIRQLEKLGAICTLREGIRKAGPVITDNGNLIIDCLWKDSSNSGLPPINPAVMENRINEITGVVENGFFTRPRPTVFIARQDGSVSIRP
jgi:ribose 5-phosphate isomerase A